MAEIIMDSTQGDKTAEKAAAPADNQEQKARAAARVPAKRKKKKHVVRKIVIAVLILAVLAGVGLYLYDSLRAQYTVSYTPYTASIGSINNSLSFSGSLSLVDSTAYTASSAGTVRSIKVAEGDKVSDGDVILRLSNGESIKAEYDGTVNRIYVEEGDEVNAGDQLCQVADFNHMKVTLRVDEYDISEVTVGTQCTVNTTATEQSFPSEISSIDYISASNGNVAYYSAICYVDIPDDSGVYPGMQVTVTIPQESAENVVVLKEDALSFDSDNSAFVYVKNDAGEMEKRSVTVGVSNGNYVEIKDGLTDGETAYAVTETESTSTLSSLMSGAFGSTNIMGGGSMPSGDFSGGGNFSGHSSHDSSGSGSSGGGMPSAPSGGFGGN